MKKKVLKKKKIQNEDSGVPLNGRGSGGQADSDWNRMSQKSVGVKGNGAEIMRRLGLEHEPNIRTQDDFKKKPDIILRLKNIYYDMMKNMEK